jgi:hypothetical protein
MALGAFDSACSKGIEPVLVLRGLVRALDCAAAIAVLPPPLGFAGDE